MRAILLALLLTAVRLSGATYYVDYDAGSDSNAGTSSGAPFKRSPGDLSATGTAAATSLTAGDTVLFKGGVTYVSPLGITFNGLGSAAGSPIIFDCSGETYGTSRAIITATNAPIELFAFSNVNNLIFKGGLITNVGGYRQDDPIWATTTPITSPPYGGGLAFYSATNVIITNVILSQTGQWTNAAPMSGANSVTGRAIYINGGTNVVITTCEITRSGVGIALKASPISSHILITNCTVHNFVNWGVDVNPAANGLIEYVEIAYNTFRDTKQFDSNRWTGYGGNPHNNKIFFRTSTITSTWTNNSIHHNWFYDDDVGAVGGTSQIFVSQGPSVDIYCNKFSGRSADGDIQLGWAKVGVTYQKVRIFNNTLNTTSRALGSGLNTFNADVLIIANNVFRRVTSTRNINAISLNTNALWGSAQSFSDYNVTHSDYSPIANYFAYYLNYYATFATWKATLLQDSNSFQADPQFVYTAGLPSTWDLHPLATSPLLEAGTNLTAIVGSGIKDFDGNAFPASGPWPIGAYGSTNSFAVEPEVLTATIDSTGTNWTLGMNQASYVGSGGAAGFTATMTLGAQTLTYVSGSGSETLNYTSSRINFAGEAGTLSYTQPGNGIEASDGTDVATFSGLVVINNSSQQQPAPSGASFSVRLGGLKGFKVGELLESVVPHNHPASPLIFETFDSSGYDLAGWAEVLTGSGGVVDEDYTTNILSGTQSLHIKIPDDENGYVTNSFAANNAVYAYFQFRPLSFPTGEDQWKSIFRLEDSEGNRLCKVQIQESGFLRVVTGVSSATLAQVVSVGTTYHVWVYWDNDNGSDSECSLAVSTDKIKPSSGDYFTSITGTQTATQASRVRLGGGSDAEDAATGGCSFVLDYLLVDDVEILSYP